MLGPYGTLGQGGGDLPCSLVWSQLYSCLCPWI